jgi:hypothetical protein
MCVGACLRGEQLLDDALGLGDEHHDLRSGLPDEHRLDVDIDLGVSNGVDNDDLYEPVLDPCPRDLHRRSLNLDFNSSSARPCSARHETGAGRSGPVGRSADPAANQRLPGAWAIPAQAQAARRPQAWEGLHGHGHAGGRRAIRV